ncbi:hypothetical protein WK07_10855 [Burkholderia multivorans]|uniref:hypothetical protein n=1 Tax=Burkholderia multivorans TaxID=87883 RepID=UPI000752B33D|nr:hypothetical protein [Burkholderia multivorans]KVQ81981.1 hypothetical protein WK07_10855 [Burkholderia multivorans]
MSPRSYQIIRRTGLNLSASVILSVLEIGISGLVVQQVQAVSLPLLAVILTGNLLIAMTIPIE